MRSPIRIFFDAFDDAWAAAGGGGATSGGSITPAYGPAELYISNGADRPTAPIVPVAPIAAPTPTFDALDAAWAAAAAPAVPTLPARAALPTNDLSAVTGMIGNGLTMGWSDEIGGKLAQYDNRFQNWLGNSTGITDDQAYQQRADELRARNKAMEDYAPWASAGLKIAGAAIPTLATGGAGLLLRAPGAVAESIPLAGTLGRTLLGVGYKEAPTVGQLAAQGLVQGGVTGAGEANEGNRWIGAGIGGTLGAVLTPAIGKTLEHGIKAASNWVSSHAPVPGTRVVAPERGSLSGAPGASFYDPADIHIAKQYIGKPIPELEAQAADLIQAVDEGTPAFLPDLVEWEKVSRNAKTIANYGPSIGYSKAQIAGRMGDAADARIGSLLDRIAPEVETGEAGVSLMNASQKAVSDLAKIRKEATKPLYDVLERQKVPDEIALPLLDDPVIADAVKEIGNIPAYKKELGDAGIDSFKYLQLVKTRLNEKSKELAPTAGDQAKIIADSKETVVSALEKLEEWRTANDLYRQLSKPINRLKGTKEESGLLEGILTKDRLKAHEAPAELLKLTPPQIREAKEALGEKGQEQLSKSARALMQEVLGKAHEQNQPALKLLTTGNAKDKFAAMIGDDVFPAFNKALELEKLMARQNVWYNPRGGSPTYGHLEEAKEIVQNAGLIKKILSGDWQAALGYFFNGDMPEELAREVAKRYFDPQAGKETIQKIIPLLKQYAANQVAAGNVSKAAAPTAAQATGFIPEQYTPKEGANPMEAYIGEAVSNSAPAAKSAAPATPSTKPETRGMLKMPEESASVELTPIPSQLNNLSKQERIKKTAAFVDSQPPLIKAIIKAESSGDPFIMSDRGALGLMQLKGEIGKAYGAKDRLDPRQNVKAGTAFFNELVEKYDDPKIALAAYNLGETKLNKKIKAAGLTAKTATWEKIKSFLPKETQDYPGRVFKHLEA